MELLKKMNHKNQSIVHLINPPDSFELTKAEINKIMEVSEDLEGNEPVLFVLAFFAKKSEIREVIEKLMKKVNKDALIWLCYPKNHLKIISPISLGTLDGKLWEYMHTNR